MVLNDLHLTWATTKNLVLIPWLTLIPWEFVYLKTGEGMGGWVQVSSWDLTLTYQGGEKGLLKICLKLHKLMGMARIIWLKMHFKMLPRGMRIWWLVKLHIYDPWWIAHYIHGWWTSGLLYFTVYLPWKICFIFDISLIKCRNKKMLNWAFN